MERAPALAVVGLGQGSAVGHWAGARTIDHMAARRPVSCEVAVKPPEMPGDTDDVAPIAVVMWPLPEPAIWDRSVTLAGRVQLVLVLVRSVQTDNTVLALAVTATVGVVWVALRAESNARLLAEIDPTPL